MKDAVKKVIPTRWWWIFRAPSRGWSKLRYSSHCPINLPWFKVTNDNCDLAHIHRIGLKEGWPSSHKEILIYSVLWPIHSAARAAVFALLYGKNTRRNYGIGMFTQWIQMVRFANVYNITSESYYRFRLWDTDVQKRVDRYIQSHEVGALTRWRNKGINTDRLDNKALFFKTCQQFNIPTVSAIVVFEENGKEQWHAEPGRIPKSNIFVKVTDLWAGQGIEAWDYDHKSSTWAYEGMVLNEHQLLARWRERTNNRGLIIQPWLKNHPSVAMFSARGLCTLRVVTNFATEMSKPECLVSIWRMPVGASHLDSFSTGGIAAAVSESGYLGPAIGMNASTGTLTHHPTTNAPILDEQLRHWREMVKLAFTAHEKFRVPNSIGWDIALVDEGPIILEGNTSWGADVAQMPSNLPLGETKFVELFDKAR